MKRNGGKEYDRFEMKFAILCNL